MFCAKFVAQRWSEASKLLQKLETVGSIDPQVASRILRQCAGFKVSVAMNDIHFSGTPIQR